MDSNDSSTKFYNPKHSTPTPEPQQAIMVNRRVSLRFKTVKGCELASLPLAIDNVTKMSNHTYKGKKVPIMVPLSHFKVYGPGIYHFFYFIKYLTILFFCMSLVTLISMIYNLCAGSGFTSAQSSLSIYAAQLSVANLAPNAGGVPTADYGINLKNKLLNIIPDMITCCMFLGFYMFWEIKSDKLTDQVKKHIRLQCYSTIQLVDFPRECNEEEVRVFFGQFGEVKAVAPVQEYDQVIAYSKKIFTLELRLKELQLQGEQSMTEKLQFEIKQVKQKIEQLSLQTEHCLSQVTQQIQKYFVTYSSIQNRTEVLTHFSKYEKCCWRGTVPQEDLLLGKPVKIQRCHTEPGDIIWQNIHITWRSRLFRNLLQFILLLLLIITVFLAISFLNILAPKTSANINSSMYDTNNITSVTNSTIVRDWCIKNTAKQTTNTLITLCKPYLDQYYINIAITIAITIIIVIIKTILKQLVLYLSRFQRYTNQTQQSVDMIANLFYTYLCTTALITFLLQARVFGVSFKYLLSYFINNSYLVNNLESLNDYEDFVPYWYVDIGYQLCFTWAILAVQVPVIGPITCYLFECFSQWRAKHEKIQKNMEDRLMPAEFEIEDHYANLLLILFVGMAFSGGMPLILIPCTLAFATRYLYFRLLFIRFSRIPKSWDEAINQRVINYLPFAILLHCAFSIWIFSCDLIFLPQVDGLSSFVGKLGGFLNRLGSTWYYTLFVAAVLLFLLCKGFIYDIIYENIRDAGKEGRVPTLVLKKEKEQELVVATVAGAMHSGATKKLLSDRSLAKGYRIEDNSDYFEVLAIMDRLKQRKLKRDMSKAVATPRGL